MREKDIGKVPKKSRVHEIANHREKEREARIQRIEEEFRRGFEFLEKYDKAVSIFGSSRTHLEESVYKETIELARIFAEDDFAVITGGGPGVMEAANQGAYEAGGQSVGINIKLEEEQRTNEYVKESEAFHYFFSRKVMLAFASQIYVFMPGGFGTLDEFFEITTLVQTEKIKPIPIILMHSGYWKPLLEWIEENVYEKHGAIEKDDTNIYTLVDTPEDAYSIARKFLDNNHNS